MVVVGFRVRPYWPSRGCSAGGALEDLVCAGHLKAVAALRLQELARLRGGGQGQMTVIMRVLHAEGKDHVGLGFSGCDESR